MSRPLLKLSGMVLALWAAGAVLVDPGTASAGIAPVQSCGLAPFSGLQATTEQSADSAVNSLWQPVLPSAPALSHDLATDARVSPMFSEPDSLSPSSDAPASPDIFSLPTHSMMMGGPGPIHSEHVNSIPDLPALWSGITSLAGIVGAGALKRVRRSLR